MGLNLTILFFQLLRIGQRDGKKTTKCPLIFLGIILKVLWRLRPTGVQARQAYTGDISNKQNVPRKLNAWDPVLKSKAGLTGCNLNFFGGWKKKILNSRSDWAEGITQWKGTCTLRFNRHFKKRTLEAEADSLSLRPVVDFFLNIILLFYKH